MVQKAVEMGASRLQPVMTRHAQVARVNLERMRANAIEAAEQCGILTLPEIGAPLAFDRMIAARDPARLLVFCDEDADVKDPVAALAAPRARAASRCRSPCCRPGRRLRRPTSARRSLAPAEYGAAGARAPHPARRYRRGGGAGAGRQPCWATGGARLMTRFVDCVKGFGGLASN